MKCLLIGAGIMLAAITLQLAMVVDLIEPSLALSLTGYAALFAGMALGVVGAIARWR